MNSCVYDNRFFVFRNFYYGLQIETYFLNGYNDELEKKPFKKNLHKIEVLSRNFSSCSLRLTFANKRG